MSKINQPFDFLEQTKFLKTILHENFALLHNDYRPLQEFDEVMRQFGRDFLRNYLMNKRDHMDRTTEELEQEIIDFERLIYGTENNEQKIA